MSALVIFDLDETLFHTEHQALSTDFNWNKHSRSYQVDPRLRLNRIAATFEDEYFRYICYPRPGAEQFVEQTKNIPADLAVWTSSTADYAKYLLDELFPGFRHQLLFLWSRTDCHIKKSVFSNQTLYLKNLDRVVEAYPYQISQIIAVDDSPEKLSRHPKNLALIKSWLGDPEDSELKKLQVFLEGMPVDETDLRAYIKQNWNRMRREKIFF